MSGQGYWRQVQEWCLGANDHYLTCFLAMVGNHHVIVTTVNGKAEIMSDGEIERAAAVWTGFVANDPATWRGLPVITMLSDWARDGWPGDPTLKPLAWTAIEPGDIPEGIDQYGGIYGWVMLPKGADGEWDFTDEAVINDAPGVGGHAMLWVGAEPGFSQVVTFATVKTVSDAWMAKYGGGYFAVRHPAWHRPGGSPLIV